MALWGKLDQANNAPKFVADSNTGQTGIQEYGETVFGYTPAEQTADGGKAASPGWIRIVKGTGPLVSFEVANGGTGYSNDDIVTVTAASGVDATGDITTNGSGVITSIAVDDAGGLFEIDADVDITTSAGTGASINAVYGGRAGRVSYETLVAMKTIA